MNSKGPEIVPWNTPDVASHLWIKEEFNLTLCFLPERKPFINSRGPKLKSYACSLAINNW